MFRLLMTFMVLFTFIGFNTAEASRSTPKGHLVKLSKFRVQKENLYQAVKGHDIEMDEAAAIIGVESGWNVSIRNTSGSGAGGLFQYIPSTWNHEKKLFHKQAKISPNASRFKAIPNLRIGVMGLERNKEILKQKTGLKHVRLGDLYLTHLLGVDAAARVINGKQNAKLSRYIKMTKGNLPLYTNSKGRVLTVSQFRAKIHRKLEKERSLYKRELMNYQLSKFIANLDMSKKDIEIADTNSTQGCKWYDTKNCSA